MVLREQEMVWYGCYERRAGGPRRGEASAKTETTEGAVSAGTDSLVSATSRTSSADGAKETEAEAYVQTPQSCDA